MNLPVVVIRSRNDRPLIERTVAMVRQQSVPCELLAFDNASTDGTGAILKAAADRYFTVSEGTYIPGQVLNRAMQETESEFVVFLNADCTPAHDQWLEQMLAGFTPECAAVFGQQMPRPGCHPLYARDTEATYGDGSRQRFWRHCFSMASCAIRRSVWQDIPFDETIRYSEDIEWSWRARQRGWRIRYVSEARVFHSHNYTWRQFYHRQYGEGYSEASIFEWSHWQRSLLRYSVLPYLRQVAGDIRYCVNHRAYGAAFAAPMLRSAQLFGRRAGFQAGWMAREANG